MKKLLVFVLIVGGVLAYTNPGMEEFSDYARDISQEMIQDEVGDNAIGRAVAQFGSSLAGDFANELTERKNYVVYSTYTIGSDNPDWKFLGIAGRFIQLNRPSSRNEEN
jgi:hypothetical protein